MSHEPEYLDEEARSTLRIGERVILHGQRFWVMTDPGNPLHPVFEPPAEAIFVEPDLDRMFRDRRKS